MARRAAFAHGETERRLNDHLRAGSLALTTSEAALLRVLISVADWRTGVIPVSADQLAVLAVMHRDTVCRLRSRLCEMGVIVEKWRTSTQVQYGLGDVLRCTT